MPPVTPGRIVHFYSLAVADRDPAKPGYGFNGEGVGPYVAVVTQVFPPAQYANLLVLPPFGEPFHQGSVLHKDDAAAYMPVGEDGKRAEPTLYWDWPPMPAAAPTPVVQTMICKIDADSVVAAARAVQRAIEADEAAMDGA